MQPLQGAHYKWVIRLAKYCPLDDLEEAMEYCVASQRCNTHELIAFLLYRHGETRLRKVIGNYMYNQCKARARGMEQEVKACQASQKS